MTETPEVTAEVRALKEEGYLTMVLSADIDCGDQFEISADDQPIRCTLKFNALEGKQSIIGKVWGRLIDRELAHASGWTDEEIFDQSGANWEIYEELYRCKSRIRQKFGIDEANANILVIDTVDILPEYRGSNFSLIALRSLIRHSRLNVGLVAIFLLPSQFLRPEQISHEEHEDPGWLPRMGLEKFPKDLLKARTRLQRHFEKLGFSAVPKTDFMIADPLRDLPSAEALAADATS